MIFKWLDYDRFIPLDSNLYLLSANYGQFKSPLRWTFKTNYIATILIEHVLIRGSNKFLRHSEIQLNGDQSIDSIQKNRLIETSSSVDYLLQQIGYQFMCSLNDHFSSSK